MEEDLWEDITEMGRQQRERIFNAAEYKRTEGTSRG
jgi:hypothetical protein